MDGKKRADFIRSAGLKSGFYLYWINVQRTRINICKNWPGAGANDGAGGSEKAERSCDDSVAGLNAGC